MVRIFNIFKKRRIKQETVNYDFEIELTASILAYEVARCDGEISETELALLLDEIKKISKKVGKDEKLSLLRFLYDVAYADKILEVSEERLIRRIADMINIKDIDVLKIKNTSKENKT